MHPNNAAPRLFYGWVVVWSAHLSLALCFGTAYAFSSFFLAIQQEFAASRTGVSLVFSLAAFAYYLVGAFSGALADRVPTRLVVMAGVLLFYGCGLGLGVGLMYVPAISAVPPWFARQRGRATGIATAGTGVGTLCLPLLARIRVICMGLAPSPAGGGLG